MDPMTEIEPSTAENIIDFSKFNTPYSFLYDHFGIAFLFRLFMIIYGEFHDQALHLNYTDIDYRVFSDAATWVSQEKSPYNRDTYRYTPLLAYMLLPNNFIHPAFGKALFAFLDVVAAYLTFIILQRMKVNKDTMKNCMMVALYNPVAINVSTRGNAESIMSVLCLLNLVLHMDRKCLLSGLVFGLSVHFKIYPICYAVPLYFYCTSEREEGSSIGMKRIIRLLTPNKNKIAFVLSSALSFCILTGLFYAIYGQEFIKETYLYHLTRRDIQHNFSPWFYILRKTVGSPYEQALNLAPFVPQVAFWIWYSFKYFRDLPFVCFLNTFVFVIFNKVCTVQYFMWYLTFLPLVIPKFGYPLSPRLKSLGYSWFGSMAFWLGTAYLFEFQQQEVLFLVWVASLLFMAVNIMMLLTVTDIASVRSKLSATPKSQAAQEVNLNRRKVAAGDSTAEDKKKI
ncbi:hypothetical protein RvY_08183 [Ramazzottius varieornatus]|uniref:GPI alpha-1,4-mannosyltransferase I, catalytic subunit n=1 Tax=Ramazzottius varieornatus TaxID=947166 RepID=A0A1D1V4Z2_RAMVA|nr:hypothetical protein RvY_08183 [Ramazzottius varieornatus]